MRKMKSGSIMTATGLVTLTLLATPRAALAEQATVGEGGTEAPVAQTVDGDAIAQQDEGTRASGETEGRETNADQAQVGEPEASEVPQAVGGDDDPIAQSADTEDGAALQTPSAQSAPGAGAAGGQAHVDAAQDVTARPKPSAAEHGVPLLSVYIEQGDAALAERRAQDGDHAYGTVDEMRDDLDHELRCIGAAEITVPVDFAGEYGTNAAPVGALDLKYLRGRGNSTWQGTGEGRPAKLPYKIVFQDKQNLFGMGRSAEYALIANNYDHSLIRNRISGWLGEQLGIPYTLQMVPIELEFVILKDGREVDRISLGSYYLSEFATVEKSRVDIDELEDDVDAAEPNADDNVTGGYLLANEVSNPENKSHSVTIVTPSGNRFVFESPEYERDTMTAAQQAQLAYITDYLNQIDKLIMKPEVIDSATHDAIDDLMDLASAVDYWWVQELSSNYDAFRQDSTKLAKPRGGKLVWGPLWDFDFAWMDRLHIGVSSEGFSNTYGSIWIDKLRDADERFVEMLKWRWADPVGGIDARLDELVRPGGVIDRYRDELAASGVADQVRWKEGSKGFLAEVEELRSWIVRRRAWINAHLETVGRAHYVVSYEAEGAVVTSSRTRELDELSDWLAPEAPDVAGKTFMGWREKRTGAAHEGFKVAGDTTFVADYRDDADIDFPSKLFFYTRDRWAEKGARFSNVTHLFPEDAIVGKISYSSSNEGVATVMPDGTVTAVGVGEATITATLKNGISSSYTVHVYDRDATPAAGPTALEVDDKLEVAAGDQAQVGRRVTASGSPVAAHGIEYTSSDESIATIDCMGVVVGLRPGKATITVRVTPREGAEMSFEPLVACCEVEVKAASGEGDKRSFGSAARRQDKAGGDSAVAKQGKQMRRASRVVGAYGAMGRASGDCGTTVPDRVVAEATGPASPTSPGKAPQASQALPRTADPAATKGLGAILAAAFSALGGGLLSRRRS